MAIFPRSSGSSPAWPYPANASSPSTVRSGAPQSPATRTFFTSAPSTMSWPCARVSHSFTCCRYPASPAGRSPSACIRVATYFSAMACARVPVPRPSRRSSERNRTVAEMDSGRTASSAGRPRSSSAPATRTSIHIPRTLACGLWTSASRTSPACCGRTACGSRPPRSRTLRRRRCSSEWKIAPPFAVRCARRWSSGDRTRPSSTGCSSCISPAPRTWSKVCRTRSSMRSRARNWTSCSWRRSLGCWPGCRRSRRRSRRAAPISSRGSCGRRCSASTSADCRARCSEASTPAGCCRRQEGRWRKRSCSSCCTSSSSAASIPRGWSWPAGRFHRRCRRWRKQPGASPIASRRRATPRRAATSPSCIAASPPSPPTRCNACARWCVGSRSG